MSAVPLLQLAGYGIAFGQRTVLAGADLRLPAAPGCTVLLGPSGTGKSTLLRTLAGFNAPNPTLSTWGEARYLGAPCAGDNRPALVMQHARLLVADVRENLCCALPERASLTRAAQIDHLEPLLAGLGQQALLDHLDRPVVDLPLQTQRLIAVLRLLVTDPALLMVDEPTAGLREDEAVPLLDLLARLGRSRALLVVLHNLREARQLAQQVVLLASGQVQEAAPAADFFAAPASDSGRRFLATGSCPETTPAPLAAPAEEDTAAPASASAADSAAPSAVPPAAPPARAAARGPRGFLWLIPGKLAGTPYPGIVHDTDADLAALREVGITRLISLTEEAFDPALAARYGMRCRPCPMPDMHAPEPADALALCADIDAYLAAGEVVAVHCRAGLGRTGTVLAAYHLWQAQGRMSALQALEDVRRIEPLWVQSRAQVDFLESFAGILARRFSPVLQAAPAEP